MTSISLGLRAGAATIGTNLDSLALTASPRPATVRHQGASHGRRQRMMALPDIEAQLSYAYLHAVASHAGIACQEATRSLDNAGVDATLHLIKNFGPTAKLTEISLHIQLKATVQPPTRQADGLSYFLRETAHYDRLRSESALPPRLLAVLFLPPNHPEWLTHSPDQLVLSRAAYWVSLLDAPPSTNTSGQTIYLPESQPLSPAGLHDLFRRVAHQERLRYEH